jgi:DNA-directed RNA polymerase subunit K/omega
MLAVREIEQGKWLVVVYKELSASDGFVITSFVTRRAKQLERRKQIWP